MQVYRGYRDVNPNQINHRFISDSYYGPAIYLALNFTDAEGYTSSHSTKGSSRKVVVEYEIDESNLLVLSNEDILNLHKFSIDSISSLDKELQLSKKIVELLGLDQNLIDPTKLASIALSKGYFGLKLLGKVEGGQQVVIPDGSPLEVSVVSIKVGTWIFSSEMATKYCEAIQELWGIIVQKETGFYWFSYNPQLSDSVDDFLDFHDSIGSDVLSIDYVNKKVVYYEED